MSNLNDKSRSSDKRRGRRYRIMSGPFACAKYLRIFKYATIGHHSLIKTGKRFNVSSRTVSRVKQSLSNQSVRDEMLGRVRRAQKMLHV